MYRIQYKYSDRWQAFTALPLLPLEEANETASWLAAMTLIEFRIVGGNTESTIN